MSNHTFGNLVGRAIHGSIGEPWDFESEAGANVISGTVEAVSQFDNPSQWILCRIRPFVHSGKSIEHVVAVLRYRKKETFDDLCFGKRIGANLVFEPGGSLASAADVSRLLAVHGHPFLAGSIEIG